MKTPGMLAALNLAQGVDEFGCAHLVISDGNVDDGDIDYCLADCRNPDEYALRDPLNEGPQGRERAIAWLNAMRALDEDAREWVWQMVR